MRRISPSAVMLIEALMVMVILSIIAAFAYQNFWKSAEKTKMRAAWSMLRSIDAAIRSCGQDHQDVAGFNAPACSTFGSLSGNGYLDDPNQGQADWEYSINAAQSRVEARRLIGSCFNKRLRRYYPGAPSGKEGNEEETMPGCP